MNKETAKQQIKELVKEFFSYPEEERDKKPEEQIKFLFIEPLLEALGWKKQDIEKEPRILKGRADYVFRLENKNVLVIEAKRTGVSLTEEEGRQAVSYAYHQKIKFAVLTNFNEIRIYHALSNIKNITKNLLKDKIGYLWIKCENFEKQFDRLWLLSRESFEKEEINKLLSAKDERLSKPIDESILDDLLQFREWLSKDLKKLRTYLTKEQIDEVVQILIDRLIFMRSVEDRGLEEKDFLSNMVSDFQEGRTTKRIWQSLLTEFRRFDKEYNSKLFQEGLLEKEAFFDEDTLIKFIKGLYFGTKAQQEKYMFDQIPGDLLGDIYEQYLGTILSGTEKRVKLESETGKRKKMGIYYTPSYIVDYIVKNTVGEYIKDKSIDEILNVKILDPACGSGSFLTRAFREVCNVIESKLKNGEKSEKWATFKNYSGRLNLSQKTTILINCIFGVDLDEKAVELAQLNLLLKLLDDETRETKKLLLPNMKDNIKCGNSLIDDRKVAGDKAFNWHAQFPDIFKQGRFDVVIGNPPWGASFNENEAAYFRVKYQVFRDASDVYACFMEAGLAKLKSGGRFSFIVPSAWLGGPRYKSLRELLMKYEIGNVILLPFDVFPDAYVDTAIFVVSKVAASTAHQVRTYVYGKRRKLTSIALSENEYRHINQEEWKRTESKKFILDPGAIKLLNQIRARCTTTFGDVVDIKRGVLFGKELLTPRQTSANSHRYFGGDVYRYQLNLVVNRWIEFDDRIKERPKEFIWFEGPRILLRRLVNRRQRLMATFTSDTFITNKNLYSVLLKNKSLDILVVLGVLNSRLISYLYINEVTQATKDDFPQVTIKDVVALPFPPMTAPARHDKMVTLVKQMLELQEKYHSQKIAGHEKERLEQQIKQLDWEIDEEVYKLYNITEEEKKIIEESLK
jgi:type I restriction-modification system DNA methylase subunit